MGLVSQRILAHLEYDPELPRLAGLPTTKSSDCQMIVAGALMRVRRFAPGDPAWRGSSFAAEVSGVLDRTAHFWAQAVAPTAERRDELLAAVGTLVTA
jgi:hypothetical protein